MSHFPESSFRRIMDNFKVEKALVALLQACTNNFGIEGVYLCNAVPKEHRWILDEHLPEYFAWGTHLGLPIGQGHFGPGVTNIISEMGGDINQVNWALRIHFLSIVGRAYRYRLAVLPSSRSLLFVGENQTLHPSWVPETSRGR